MDEEESGIIDPDEADITSDAVVVSLQDGWMSYEESEDLGDLTRKQLEERIEESKDIRRGIYIDEVANYLEEELPDFYLEKRGRPALICEAAIIVDRTFENDYSVLSGDEHIEAMLSDAGYSAGNK